MVVGTAIHNQVEEARLPCMLGASWGAPEEQALHSILKRQTLEVERRPEISSKTAFAQSGEGNEEGVLGDVVLNRWCMTELVPLDPLGMCLHKGPNLLVGG